MPACYNCHGRGYTEWRRPKASTFDASMREWRESDGPTFEVILVKRCCRVCEGTGALGYRYRAVYTRFEKTSIPFGGIVPVLEFPYGGIEHGLRWEREHGQKV